MFAFANKFYLIYRPCLCLCYRVPVVQYHHVGVRFNPIQILRNARVYGWASHAAPQERGERVQPDQERTSRYDVNRGQWTTFVTRTGTATVARDADMLIGNGEWERDATVEVTHDVIAHQAQIVER